MSNTRTWTVDEINALSPSSARLLRSELLQQVTSSTGRDREHASRLLLHVDVRLGRESSANVEHRADQAREALGLKPSGDERDARKRARAFAAELHGGAAQAKRAGYGDPEAR